MAVNVTQNDLTLCIESVLRDSWPVWKLPATFILNKFPETAFGSFGINFGVTTFCLGVHYVLRKKSYILSEVNIKKHFI